MIYVESVSNTSTNNFYELDTTHTATQSHPHTAHSLLALFGDVCWEEVLAVHDSGECLPRPSVGEWGAASDEHE